ncbi:MAG: PAC2 family protein [archaeon]
MKILLKKKPINPIIIEGFPGFGLIGTIVTEFLIEHLKCELIGEFLYDDLPAMIAIHNGVLVKPMAVHYSKKYNIIILQTILNPKGKEWDIADAIVEMAHKVDAKKIISIEGVASQTASKTGDTRLFYYGDDKLKKLGLDPIKESIVVGVTSSVMLRADNSVCIFAETHSALPDSQAASKVIEVLDKYLDLKVDPKPLLKQAKDFEDKLKNIMQQTSKTVDEHEKKYMSYLG